MYVKESVYCCCHEEMMGVTLHKVSRWNENQWDQNLSTERLQRPKGPSPAPPTATYTF